MPAWKYPVFAPAALGCGLAAVLGAGAVVRRNKPLHSYGVVVQGSLRVTPSGRCGVPLLDMPATHPVLCRVSRALSLAYRGPDIFGMALRIGTATSRQSAVDLLFASTGTGNVSRYLLSLRTTINQGPLTTLLPMQAARKPLVLALEPHGREYELLRSGARGPWISCGWLQIDPLNGAGDELIRFDPVRHHPPGLCPPQWVADLRTPAYDLARRLTGKK